MVLYRGSGQQKLAPRAMEGRQAWNGTWGTMQHIKPSRGSGVRACEALSNNSRQPFLRRYRGFGLFVTNPTFHFRPTGLPFHAGLISVDRYRGIKHALTILPQHNT